jgi:hypothetical protein
MTRHDADLGDRDPAALQATMSASVSGIRMPADLLDRAVRGNRRRKARNRLTAAAGAAATMAAVAIVLAGLPGSPSRHPVSARHAGSAQAQTAAYVLQRAAAAQVNSRRLISVDYQPGGGGTLYTDVATQQQRYNTRLRASSGRPYLQWSSIIRHGAITETDVEYQHDVYSVLISSSYDQGQHSSVTISSWLPLQTSPDPTIAFKHALKAGIITVVGHRTLRGRDTILLHVNQPVIKRPPPPPGSTCIATPRPPDPPSSIWIDASTYLVVQTEHWLPDPHLHTTPVPGSVKWSWIGPPNGHRTCSHGTGWQTWSPVIDEVTWLRPIPANLALLTVHPPAGFIQVSYSQMAQQYLGPIS